MTLPFLLALLTGEFDAPSDGSELLERAAARSAKLAGLRYQGERQVIVYVRGEPRVHIERVLRDGARLRIDFPPGSRFGGQTVVETGSSRKLYLPERREVRLLAARGDESERRLRRYAALAKKGEVTVAVSDGGRIAGFATTRLTLRDDRGVALAEFAVEPERAFVLRRVAYDPEGKPLGSTVFTRLRFLPAVDPAAFVVEGNDWRVVRPGDELRRLTKEVGVGFAVLPPSSGFRLDGARVRAFGGGRILASFYEGGGRRLTLFASSAPLPELTPRESGKRPGSPRVGITAWHRGTTYYALAGEVSAERLAEIAAIVVFDPSIRLP